MFETTTLENYAFTLMTQSEETLLLVGIGAIFAGVFFGLIIRTGAGMTLKRVPYLIWSGAMYLALSMVPLVWLLTFDAIEQQMLWALVAIAFGSMLLFGIVGGVLAHARSVSAYGSGSRGFYAIVPILNLVLLFKRPIEMTRAGPGGRARNAMGVLVGVTLLGLGGLMDYLVREQTDALALEVEFNEGMQATSVEMMVKAIGLEEALREIARDTPGQQVDEITVLMGARSDGDVLRYTYQVDTNEVTLPDHLRMEIAQQTCDHVPLYPVIRAGATIEDVYLRDDGVELGRVQVTRASCAF